MADPTSGSSWTETTIASLRSKGHRNGGARRAVIELLGRQQCCLTAQQIFDQLRAEDRRVGTASVYRALEQLTKDGFVQRIDIGAGTSRFEPIHADGEHHHPPGLRRLRQGRGICRRRARTRRCTRSKDKPATPSPATTSSSAARAPTAPPRAHA